MNHRKLDLKIVKKTKIKNVFVGCASHPPTGSGDLPVCRIA
jgi:hypothetical protein